MNTAARLDIEFVSDVVCPWCAIGLSSLEQALARLAGEVEVDLRFSPFELNPDMGPEGAEVVPYLSAKYGMSAEDVARNQQMIAERGAAVGFVFDMSRRSRTYNTFDAHRLMHAADEVGAGVQRALAHALFVAHFTEGRNPGEREVLLNCATAAGWDVAGASQVVDSDEHADAVLAQEHRIRQAGIASVPALVVNGRYLISGGQPSEVYEQALRRIAAEPS